MKLAEATTLLADLIEIEAISQAAMSPDGRWKIFQDWLRQNPKWNKQVDAWIELTPDEALSGLFQFVAKHAEMPTVVIEEFTSPEIKARAKTAIETIQALYRERKGVEA